MLGCLNRDDGKLHLGLGVEAVLVLCGALQGVEVEVGAPADQSLQLLRLKELHQQLIVPPHLRPSPALVSNSHSPKMATTEGLRPDFKQLPIHQQVVIYLADPS